MKLSLLTVWLFGWLWLTGVVAVAQDDRTYQAFTRQGQRYEGQGNYKQALDAYRKALPYASAENRKALDQTIARLEGMAQDNEPTTAPKTTGGSVDQAKLDEIQRKISSLTRAQARRQFQEDFNTLQQKGSVAVADYQGLLRRVEAMKEAETNVQNSPRADPVVSKPPPAQKPTVSPRVTPKIVPPPPQKAITISMPDTPPADAPKGNRDLRTTKSGKPLLNNTSKSARSNQ